MARVRPRMKLVVLSTRYKMKVCGFVHEVQDEGMWICPRGIR